MDQPELGDLNITMDHSEYLKDAHNPPQPNVATGKLQPYIETKLDIILLYQIFPNDEIGSGH